jgi:5-formyltetrahydrofolate cyclo-ligase
MPGLQIAYPVASFEDHTMKVLLVNDDTDFKKNKYGIAEPVNGTEIAAAAIDMIFVPLLAFDKQGHRLGYGKGFYDRFLPGCREDSIKIGFSYFEPLASIGDVSQFDVPLTTGITPENIYEF